MRKMSLRRCSLVVPVVVLALLTLNSGELSAQTLIFEDPLTSPTEPTGYRLGTCNGSFTAEGFKLTEKDDGLPIQPYHNGFVEYFIPPSVLLNPAEKFSDIKVSFKLKNFFFDRETFPLTNSGTNCNPTCEEDPHFIIFLIWSAPGTDVKGDDYYLKLGEWYDFRCNLGLRHTPGPACTDTDGQGNKVYYEDEENIFNTTESGDGEILVELLWTRTTTTLYFDGELIVHRQLTDRCADADYAPENLHISLGTWNTCNPISWGEAPFGAIYSDLKIYDMSAPGEPTDLRVVKNK